MVLDILGSAIKSWEESTIQPKAEKTKIVSYPYPILSPMSVQLVLLLLAGLALHSSSTTASINVMASV